MQRVAVKTNRIQLACSSSPLLQAARRAFASGQMDMPLVDASIDYYNVLEVKRSASQKQIRLAYFTQAKRYHPDLNAHKS